MPRPALALAVLFVLAGSVGAQTVDRSERPALGPAPAFRPPAVERFELSNGLPVLFVAKPGVPLAQVNLLVKAGAVADPEGRGGLASLTADMLDEGAGGRSALDLADAADYLGVDLTTGADLQSLQVRLHTPVSKLDSALALMADVALRPTFPADELERLRTSRLTALAQRRDEPRAVASVLFDRTLYGDASPYGRPTVGSPASVGGVERADLVAFHEVAVRPGNAALVVVGALDRADVAPRLEALFGSAAWPRGAAFAGGVVPEPTQVAERAVLLVDKPGAAQTVVRIGRVGAARSTPDYAALQVLNTVLGGSFTSRLNQNLRETNGYAYGAGSSFAFRPVAGPFVASADVQTAVTGPALTEFFRELAGVRARVPDGEVAKARNYVALSFPEPFETVRGTAAVVGDLFLDDLPLDAYDGYTASVLAVTPDDLERVAAEYVDPETVAVVLVGDRAVIEADVRALELGPVQTLTVDDVLGPQE